MASRRGEGSELQPHHRRDRLIADESDSLASSGSSIASTPIEKRGKWRQTFLLKGKGKERADTRLDSPVSPTAPILPQAQTSIVESPSPTEISDTDTIRPDSSQSRECSKPEAPRRPMSAMDSYVMVDTNIEDGSDSDSSYVLVSQRKDAPSVRPKRRASNRAASLDISVSGFISKPKTNTIKGSLKLPAIRTKMAALSTPEAIQSSHSHKTLDLNLVPPAPTQTRATSIQLITAATPVSETNTPAAVSRAATPAPPEARDILEGTGQGKVDIAAGIMSQPNNDDINSPAPAIFTNLETENMGTTIKPQLRILIEAQSSATSEGTQPSKNYPGGQEIELRPIWAGAGLFDLYRRSNSDGSIFAIKVIHTDLLPAREEFKAWSKCEHPNILKLIGLEDSPTSVRIVYPWMEKGNVREYVLKHPSVDRYQLCTQVCQGLRYLHELGIVHGGVQGSNVLVSDDGVAMVADVGISRLKPSSYTNAIHLCSPRWMALEVLRGESKCTTASDIYALAMTILEIITGKPPFYNLDDYAFLSSMIFRRVSIQPERPTDQIPTSSEYGDQMWSFLRRCWSYRTDERPSAGVAATIMQTIMYEKLNSA